MIAPRIRRFTLPRSMPVPGRGTFGDVLAGCTPGPFRVRVTRHAAEHRTPRHSHEAASINVVLSGSYHERTGRLEGQHAAGSLLYKPGGEVHANHQSVGARCLLIEFVPGGSSLEWLESPLFLRTFSGHGEAFGACARDVVRELSSVRDDAGELSILCGVLEILALAEERAGGPTTDELRGPVAEARSIVASDPALPLDLVALADGFGIRPTSLARAFRRSTGTTLGSFQRRLRVASAMRALKETDAGLADVAHDCGFCDQSHLNRVFRRHLGLTPAAFRRGARALAG